jgi:hypothetical protein
LKNHGLGAQRAVLRGAERQHIDARAPRRIGRRATEKIERVREARTIHMELEIVLMRDARDGGNLVETVASAGFGRLR